MYIFVSELLKYSIVAFLFKICSRPENEHYDPEEILSRSIQKEKNLEHSSKGNPSDPRIHESPERYRSRSSFSDR
jgi:hypothetical protein